MARPDRHIDSYELNALAPSHSEDRQEHVLSFVEVREAEAHVHTCPECAHKVMMYRKLLLGRMRRGSPLTSPARNRCQQNAGVDWNEVVAGQWPEFKARQLVLHAAMCDDCGSSLCTAVAAKNSAEMVSAQTRQAPELSETQPHPVRTSWLFSTRLIPILAVLIVLSLVSLRLITNRAVSGERFAVLAAETHQLHAGGKLDLEIRSQSTTVLNSWFHEKLKLPLSLPVIPSAGANSEEAQFEGARRLEIGGKPAAFVAYRTASGPASLIVTTESVAVASGGSVADYPKVSFHYSMVEGYKVVTWSQHGLTYALVSQEGSDTQRSCMVCHSAMHDRDLSKTPTPLRPAKGSIESVLQKL